MKSRSSAAISLAAVLLTLCVAAAAQTTPSAPLPQPPQLKSTPGQVLFSRSQQNASSAAKPSAPANVPKATNQERRALTITAYNLNIHLTPRDQSISAEARITLRNNGMQPLHEIALQISSSLQFQGVGSNGKPLVYAQQTIASDVDHTGKLTEADILLTAPLAPGATLPVQVFYSGKIPVSAQRFVSIGTPRAVAESSDWDRISEGFTGLRGFGNVVWYPVSSVPVSMGQGNRLFEEIGRQKRRESLATVTMRVTVEYFDNPPNVAVLDGRAVSIGPPVSTPTASFPGVVTVSLPRQPIGFQVLSLVLAQRQKTSQHHVDIFALPADSANVPAWLHAAAKVTPLLQKWLGAVPVTSLAVSDLPESDDAPSQVGATLLAPLTKSSSSDLTTPLIHALAHAYFHSPRGWLQEGVPSFMVTLWIESTQGRKAALEYLEGQRGALARVEEAVRLAPAGDRVDVARLQPFLDQRGPVHVDAEGAAVDLRDAHVDQALQPSIERSRAPRRRPDALVGIGVYLRPVQSLAHFCSCLHTS